MILKSSIVSCTQMMALVTGIVRRSQEGLKLEGCCMWCMNPQHSVCPFRTCFVGSSVETRWQGTLYCTQMIVCRTSSLNTAKTPQANPVGEKNAIGLAWNHDWFTFDVVVEGSVVLRGACTFAHLAR